MNLDNTKVIILAAGQGTRLRKYASDKPKGMLKLGKHSLIERQIEQFRQVGIRDISIVRGFMGHKIDFPNITYFENGDFDNSNMLVSLFTARPKLEGVTIVSYGDIVFSRSLLKKLLIESDDIVVSVDVAWQKYWLMRYGIIDYDTESLRLSQTNQIISLGVPNSNKKYIDGRYVGLLKFSQKGLNSMNKIWEKFKNDYWDKPWQVSKKPMRQAYMTDMLQALIDHNYQVRASITQNGWIEFDTDKDYENAQSWMRSGELNTVLGVET